MKTLNKIFSTMMLLGVVAGFSACTDEADYSGASKLANEQVYFSSDLSSDVSLHKDASVYNVVINRIKTDAATTVNLNVVNGSKKISVPTSVSFAAGSATANIPLTYNPDSLEYDEFADITISLADSATYSTPYGKNSYTFQAGIPAPYTSLGTGSFSDGFLFSNTYDVEVQQNDIHSNIYRLVDPYTQGLNNKDEGFTSAQLKGNQSKYVYFEILPAGSTLAGVTTTIDNLVYFDSYFTGFYNPTYSAEVKCYHPADFKKYASEAYWHYNYVKQLSSAGKPEVVVLSPYYYMDKVGGWDYTQKSSIKIVFPGCVEADYTAVVTYMGRLTDTDDVDNVMFNITLGADVETAKYALVAGKDIDAAAAGIEKGTIASKEIAASTNITLPCTDTGTYSLVVVTYIGEEAKEVGSATFDFKSSHENAETWKALGKGSYTDAFVSVLYGQDPATYDIAVEESNQTPGKYRLVNAYGAAFPYNSATDYDATKTLYLVIDASDPTAVYIPEQSLGLNYGDGAMSAYSYGAYYLDNGKTLADAKAAGVCGTLVDGVITFPTKSLFTVLGGKNYYANTKGEFKLVLPTAASAKRLLPAKTAKKSIKSANPSGQQANMRISGRTSKFSFTDMMK